MQPTSRSTTDGVSRNRWTSGEDLLGPEQKWFAQARLAIQGVEPFLTSDMRGALQTDIYTRSQDPDDLDDYTMVWEDVSEALDRLLREISEGASASSLHLQVVMDVFAAGRLVSVGEPGTPLGAWSTPTGSTGTAAVQGAILAAATSAHPAGRFTALLLSELAGDPRHAKHRLSVRMPVLMHKTARRADETESRGEVGGLTLTLWPDGPPGFHPDPRLMAYSTIDDAALDGLRTAFTISPHAETGTCVTWGIRKADGSPVRQLKGNSLSAAAAVLLEELTTDASTANRLRWRLRPRRLGRHWAITAGLNPNGLTRVSHYGSKLAAVAAATDKRLNVIVAAGNAPSIEPWDQDPVRHLAAQYGIQERVHRASTVDDAVRLTRSVNRTLAGAIIVALLFTGTIAWAKRSIDAAIIAAERKAVAADLIQQSRALLASDPGAAAYAALAADELDSSLRTQQAMADVLAATAPIIGSGEVSTWYIESLATSENTLLVADGNGVLSAWSLPDISPIGVLPATDLRGVGKGGSADFAVMMGSELHLYHAADGFIPRETRVMETSLTGAESVLGPFATSEGGVLVLTRDLQGFLWDHALRRPFDFDLSADVRLSVDPTRRSARAVDLRPTGYWSNSPTPEGSRDVADFLLATNANEVVRLRVRIDSDEPTAPYIVLETVLPPDQARAAIRTIASALDDTLLIGTDRGVQWWSPVSRETKEFPYAGWAGESDRILSVISWRPAIFAPHELGFFVEPRDERPRPQPVKLTLEGPTVSAEAEYGSDKFVVGRENGTVLVLDPSGPKFGPPAVEGTNKVLFTPTGHLLLTRGDTPQATSTLVTRSPSEESDDPISDTNGYLVDPYGNLTYDLAETNGRHPYINSTAATEEWVAASGRRVDARGTIWAWHVTGGEPATSIDFSVGESGADPIPDIVQAVGFVSGGRELVALNSAKGELGFWSVGDWEHLASVQLPVPADRDTSFATRAAFAAGGKKVAVRESATDLSIVDVETHQIVQRITDSEASYTDIALTADGDRLAVVDERRTIRVFDLEADQPTELISRTVDAVVNDMAFDPTGTRLATVAAAGSQLVLLNAEQLTPLGPPWNDPEGYNPVDVEWSPDGERVAVGTMSYRGQSPVNGTTHVLDAGTLTWRERLCAIVGTSLGESRWNELTDTDLPPPRPCNNVRPAESDVTAEDPFGDDDFTMDDLMEGAPVPEACEHEAGVLVNGKLPNQDPFTGAVWLGQVAFGDLTGDGIEDAAAVINCTAGGVMWPPILALYTRDADGSIKLLEHIDSHDEQLVGSAIAERPVVQDVEIVDGAAVYRYIANLSPDPACCGSLPIEASLRWQNEVLAVTAMRHYAEAAVNQALHSREMLLLDDKPLAPEAVIETLEEYETVTVGAALGMCNDANTLPAEQVAVVAEHFSNDDSKARYCTVVGADPHHTDYLLLRLVPGTGERYEITDAVRLDNR